MSALGLQVEALVSRTLSLAPPAVVHLLSPPLLPFSSLLFSLQSVGSGLPACTLHPFPP